MCQNTWSRREAAAATPTAASRKINTERSKHATRYKMPYCHKILSQCTSDVHFGVPESYDVRTKPKDMTIFSIVTRLLFNPGVELDSLNSTRLAGSNQATAVLE